MKSSGAAILGAAVVAIGVAFASQSSAKSVSQNPADLDADEQLRLAGNYYAMSMTNPEMWSAGQLLTLEGFLHDLGLEVESANIHDLRTGLYGDTIPTPLPLPDIRFIPQTEIDALADQAEQVEGEVMS